MTWPGDQAALDLAWAVNGTQLMSGPEMLRPDPIRPESIDRQSLAAFLTPRSTRRVGRYFEALVEYWLRRIVSAQVLGVGVQLRDGKRTVGELDFVYRIGGGPQVHLEVAVKYFLHHPDSDRSHYPGPNPRDSFEVKATKLFDEQLPRSLGHRPDVEQRRALVPGMVFYRSDEPDAEPPTRLAVDHRRGRWIRAGEWDGLDALGTRISIHRKPFWLSPPVSSESAFDGHCGVPMPVGVDALRAHFGPDRSGTPVMISVFEDDDLSPAESNRLFVVSQHWPRSGRG